MPKCEISFRMCITDVFRKIEKCTSVEKDQGGDTIYRCWHNFWRSLLVDAVTLCSYREAAKLRLVSSMRMRYTCGNKVFNLLTKPGRKFSGKKYKTKTKKITANQPCAIYSQSQLTNASAFRPNKMYTGQKKRVADKTDQKPVLDQLRKRKWN